MLIKSQNLELLYRISATARFNSERVEILEELLGKVLTEGLENVDIQKSLDDIKDAKEKEHDLFSPKGIFRNQKSITLFKIDQKQAMEYLYATYLPITNSGLCGELGYKVAISLAVCQSISHVCGSKAKSLGFKNKTYKFNDKYEYGNLSFVCIPNEDYIKIWSKSITFKTEEILKDMDGILLEGLGEHLDNVMEAGIKEAFNQLSFTQQDIQNGEPFRLEIKPLLKIDNNTYVLLGNFYILRALMYRCETLLKDCKFYRENSGKIFEINALKVIYKKFNSDLHPNITYKIDNKNYELDGLLNLKNSSWFIECASHPPDIDALFGDEIEIQEDLEKSIIHCHDQGVRDIENSELEAIKRFSPKEKKGIIIIINPYYPNMADSIYRYFESVAKELNKPVPEEIRNPLPEIKFPRYIVTYFELEKILSEYDSDLFEEFLAWRTQENMPIACLDELDYWDYFTKMYGDKEREQIFRMCQEKHNIIHYIGNRFNDKSYLEKIMENEAKEHGSEFL
jgi:hypothetical protein